MASEAGEGEAIGGGEEQVGGGGGVVRGAIKWRHQARHRPARPRLCPHLRAVPGRCARGVYSCRLASLVGFGAFSCHCLGL